MFWKKKKINAEEENFAEKWLRYAESGIVLFDSSRTMNHVPTIMTEAFEKQEQYIKERDKVLITPAPKRKTYKADHYERDYNYRNK